MERFSEQELAMAKSVDLTAVASYLGYTVKRIGQYHMLKEMDSIRIYNRTHWCRFSRRYEQGENGGSQIDFLRVFHGMEVKEAVFWLLDFSGYQRTSTEESSRQMKHQVPLISEKKKSFILPEAAKNNQYLYRYLMEERGIGKKVIDFFVQRDLMYESKSYHNMVFKGNDKDGITRFASMRGVFDHDGKSFRCDVAGNDKNYGFHVANEESKELIVFEAAIDLLSYIDIYTDFHTNKLALGMLGDAPLETFLIEHPQIVSIRFCLDNDEPGRKATEKLMEKYYENGFEVEDAAPPVGYKDYNEWLVAKKREIYTLDSHQERKVICQEGR